MYSIEMKPSALETYKVQAEKNNMVPRCLLQHGIYSSHQHRMHPPETRFPSVMSLANYKVAGRINVPFAILCVYVHQADTTFAIASCLTFLLKIQLCQKATIMFIQKIHKRLIQNHSVGLETSSKGSGDSTDCTICPKPRRPRSTAHK